ncbi:MAG: alpha/beta hydrolase [Clostridia bacterium]|nr:alpha/beta hydrolase [Clostridia bacterium]
MPNENEGIMEIKRFTLPGEDDAVVSLTAYIAGRCPNIPYNDARPGVIVIPGGGYEYCGKREGEPIALAFLAAGYNAFVLHYEVNSNERRGKPFPAQLIEAAKAMKLIKDNARELGVLKDRVFVIGFSAGGHLAATFGTMYDSDIVHNALDIPENYLRPTGIILGYPVIDGGKYAHRGSIDNILLDDKDDPEKIDFVSLQNRVDEKTVPAFLWHTAVDELVPVQNSLIFAKALADNGVPFEMHIYPSGAHGLSIATEITGRSEPVAKNWLSDALRWMSMIK